MDITEAIKTSIELEKRVRDVYVEARTAASDPIAQKIFGMLADEERGHVEYLAAKLDVWLQTGRLDASDLGTAVPSKPAIEAQVDRLKKTMNRKISGKEADYLESARRVEVETSDFYEKLAQELPPEGRGFFARFVEIEQGHLALVQAELDAVTGMGYWFDFTEFDLEKA